MSKARRHKQRTPSSVRKTPGLQVRLKSLGIPTEIFRDALMRVLPLILACFLSASAHAANKDRHVVLVTIDGFPASLWHDPALPIPTLRQLAADGASADAMTV